MGFSLSWIAIRGAAPETIHSLLSVRPTGLREDFPESDVTAAQLPSGSYLVVLNRRSLDDALLKKVSSAGELIHCYVEEHVMCSLAAGWKNGKQLWSVIHDAQKALRHLDVSGDVPKVLAVISERLNAEQDAYSDKKPEVDYIFDIPVELAKELTGFRHDQDMPGVAGDAFEVLEPIKDFNSKATLGDRLKEIFGGKSK